MCLGSLPHDPRPFVLSQVGCVGERVGVGCGVWAGAAVGGVGGCGVLTALAVVGTENGPQSGPLLGTAVTKNMLPLSGTADPKSVPDPGPEIGARFWTPHHKTYYPGISATTAMVPFPGTNFGAVFRTKICVVGVPSLSVIFGRRPAFCGSGTTMRSSWPRPVGVRSCGSTLTRPLSVCSQVRPRAQYSLQRNGCGGKGRKWSRSGRSGVV